MKKTKTFDCVEMKQQGADQVRKNTEGMNQQQVLEFWQTRSKILRERRQNLLGEVQKLDPVSTTL